MAEEMLEPTNESNGEEEVGAKSRKLVVALEPEDYKRFKQYAIDRKQPMTEVAREILEPYFNR